MYKKNQAEINKALSELKEELSKENAEFEAYIVTPAENTPLLPRK
ncbi:MAG: hypothetical protein MRECE_22c022 [Mycoplasmataceae bacterium CE_OT135]|nr:MAG: hypothetical protein MRECE_22c022 [Mycoplasmataceae bacterium CE_OT135]